MRPTKILPLICMVIAVAFIARGVYFIIMEVEQSACVVPYMYPKYQRLQMANVTSAHLHTRYSLYQYREGSIFSGWEQRGIPVLFIPGNGGSYEQVRSIGTASSRYAISLRRSHELDFYSVDFRGELSAFDGQIMQDQAEFVNDCIATILLGYKKRGINSVILVGHSIGGFVARSVFVQSNFLPGSVETLITLAAPHTMPVLSIHKSVATYYDHVNRFWSDRSHYARGGLLSNVLLVSVAGGFRDVQVRSSLADLSTFVPSEHLVFVLASAVPDVWTQADHQAAVWCTQLNAQLLRALYQAVDLRNVQPQPRLDLRAIAFREVLSSGAPSRLGFSGIAIGSPDPMQSLATTLPSALLEQLRATPDTPDHLVRLKRFSPQSTFRFVLEKRRNMDFVAIWATDSNIDVLLTNNEKTSIMNLTSKAMLWPREKRSLPSLAVVHFSERQLRPFSDVFLHRRASGTVRSPLLLAQFYLDVDSSVALRLVDHSGRLKTISTPHAALINATLTQSDRVLPYSLKTRLEGCDDEEGEAFPPFAYLVTEGLREESLLLNVTATRIRVDSLTPVSTHLVLFADPSCKYRLSLAWDIGASIGAVLHAYISELVGLVFVVLLLTLARISKSWEESGTYNDFLSALNSVLLKDSFSLLTLIGGTWLFRRHYVSLPISRILLAPEFVRNSYWYSATSIHSPAWIYAVLYFIAVGAVAGGYVLISGVIYVVLAIRYVALFLARRRHRPPLSPRLRALVFALCFAAGIYTHSVIGLVLALVAFMVFMPLDEPADGFRAYQFALVTIYGLPIVIMCFSLIIWFQVYSYAWQWFDSYEFLCAFITLHLSVASAPYPRNVQVSAAMYFLAAFLGFYALFRLYRVLYCIFILSIVLLLGHFVQPSAPPRVEWHHYK